VTRLAVQFNKEHAEAVLDAIKNGKPLPVPEGRWTGGAMLSVAGMLYAAVFSHGPQTHQVARITAAMKKAMHPEKQEAIEQTFHRDILDGIQFLSQLTFQLIHRKYDEQFGPEVVAIVYEAEDGGKRAKPAKGFKGHKDII
jgi:hypothetical protein